MEFGVWLPVYGGWLRLKNERREPDFVRCRQIARSAETHGFRYLYASENYLNCVYGPDYEVADVWMCLSAIAACTTHVNLVGGLKPGFIPPFIMAHMVNGLEWVGGERVALNVVCGWWKQEFEHCNVDMLDHDGRYSRAAEYVRCLKGLWTRKPFTFHGDYYRIENAQLAGRPYRRNQPRFWVSGHSDKAIALAGEEGDVLFVNGMTPEQVREMSRRATSVAEKAGRRLKIAANAFVVLGETDAAAARKHERFIEHRDRTLIQTFRTAMDESGAAVWTGLDESKMVDSNAGFEAGLIGSRQTIERGLAELESAGVDILMCQFAETETELREFGKIAASWHCRGGQELESCA